MARAWGLGVTTYELDRTQQFAQTADLVLTAVNDKTRLVIVNSPHNPTGSVMLPRKWHGFLGCSPSAAFH